MTKNALLLFWQNGLRTVAVLTAVLLFSPIISGNEVEIFLAPQGDDSAPGTLQKPVATLNQAKVLWNEAAKKPGVNKITVWMRGGNYALSDTFVIEDADRKVPVRIAAYGHEKPILYGSRTITGWQPSKRFSDGVIETKLDAATLKTFPNPGQLFAQDKRLTRARYPDPDPANPRYTGFKHVYKTYIRPYEYPGKLCGAVRCLGNKGKELSWKIDVPVAGTYQAWFLYCTRTSELGMEDLSGHASIQANDQKPCDLTQFKNTQAGQMLVWWMRWAKCAQLDLKKGTNTLTWRNKKGDHILLGGIVLALDPTWAPKDHVTKQFPSKPESPVLHVAAETFEPNCPDPPTVVVETMDAFEFAPGDLKSKWAVPGVELRIFPGGVRSCDAYMEINGIKKIDESKNIVTLQGNEMVSSFAVGARYFLENHPDFLTVPGEWYLDRQTGMLYLYPLEKQTAEIRADLVGTMFCVSGSNDAKAAPLTFSGLAIRETSHARGNGHVGYGTGNRGVIELNRCMNVRIEGCDFRNIGRYAVYSNGGGKHTIDHCVIRHSCSGGINSSASNGNTVSNNTIQYIGEEYRHVTGIHMGGNDNVVSHNHISYTTRWAINVGGATRQLVEYNDIAHINLETADTGGIEVTQAKEAPSSDSIIRNNRIVGTGGYVTRGWPPKEISPYHSWGIYLDSYASGFLVENNYVCDSAYGGIMLQGGAVNTVRNNIFVNGKEFQGSLSNYTNNWQKIVLEKNIFAYETTKLVFSGPPYALDPKVIRAENNFFWCPNEKTFDRSDFKQRRTAGLEKGSSFVDPMFLHPEKHDGVLSPDSPCLKKGFKPIDLSTVGPREKGGRE